MFRMSGSGGGMGATIRIYAESFERDPERHNRETQVKRKCNDVCVRLYLVSRLCHFTMLFSLTSLVTIKQIMANLY